MNTRELYAHALELLQDTPDTGEASILWREKNPTRRAMYYFEDVPQMVAFVTSVNCFTTPRLRPDPQLEPIVDKWVKILGGLIPVDESPWAIPTSIVERNGRRLSAGMLQHTYYARHIDSEAPETILEIGAGFGGLARILNTIKPRRYTIVDLPSSLFYSYVYLRAHFPDAKCWWITRPIDFEGEPDFTFVPAPNWKYLLSKRFDIGVNTCSSRSAVTSESGTMTAAPTSTSAWALKLWWSCAAEG